jgi:hypothetical protein
MRGLFGVLKASLLGISAAILASSQADAGRTVIDSVIDPITGRPRGVELSFRGYCTPFGMDCAPQALPFSIGGFSQFIPYSNGSISLGAAVQNQLEAGVSLTALSDLGVPVITPGFSNARVFFPGSADGAYVARTSSAPDILSVSFFDCRSTTTCFDRGSKLTIEQQDQNFLLSFDYFGSPQITGLSGFALGNSVFETTDLQRRSFLFDSNLQLIATNSAVPEPGTWTMMLLGFGAIGYCMRRRKVGYGGVQAA